MKPDGSQTRVSALTDHCHRHFESLASKISPRAGTGSVSPHAGVAIPQRSADFARFGLVRMAQITVLSREADVGLISEFLIVGCDHDWLGEVGYDDRRFEP